MFVLRCTFWLSLMYASVSWGTGAVRDPHAVSAAVADALGGAADATVARATEWCAARPTRCAEDAVRLTALVETTTSRLDARDEDPVLTFDQASAPMPIPDPRRRAAHAVLTEAR